ncbi:MAG: pantetheine-phosphate adenylyltransferase [Elusimicrobia bacterium]|nr:pantetheine-phosphate adenylyltransferase [Elusimicrobiota bacterium]
MKNKVIYPGSFDPPTNGHLDVIDRALTVFDKVIICIIVNPSKKTLFSADERKNMFNKIYSGDDRIEITSYSGLLVDFATEKRVNTVLRGLRAVSDFEYEFQMALMNMKLKPAVKTVYLMPSPEYTYLSSSLIKEVYSLGGDVRSFIPEVVEKYLHRKLAKKRKR